MHCSRLIGADNGADNGGADNCGASNSADHGADNGADDGADDGDDRGNGNALSFYAPRLLLHISRLCEVAGPKTCYRVFPCTCRKNQRD